MVRFYDLQTVTAMHVNEYKEAEARVIDSGGCRGMLTTNLRHIVLNI
jgi:hypothetical protein